MIVERSDAPVGSRDVGIDIREPLVDFVLDLVGVCFVAEEVDVEDDIGIRNTVSPVVDSRYVTWGGP